MSVQDMKRGTSPVFLRAQVFAQFCGIWFLGACMDTPTVGTKSQDILVDANDSSVEQPAVAPMRERQRLSIDQLENSILEVTGGLTWRIGAQDGFRVMAQTLGKADYIQTIREARKPDTVFQKFLADIAGSVCRQLVETDPLRTPDNRRLLVHVPISSTEQPTEAQEEDNLKTLLLRYHGRRFDDVNTDDDFKAWLWLYRSAKTTSANPLMAWRTVCVALLTHTDFYTY